MKDICELVYCDENTGELYEIAQHPTRWSRKKKWLAVVIVLVILAISIIVIKQCERGEIPATKTESQILKNLAEPIVDTIVDNKDVIRKTDAVIKQQDYAKPTPLLSNELDLGFASYLGETSGNKAHGVGTMTFKQRHSIPGASNYEAEPGEKVEGNWREGRINSGTWYRNDESKHSIVSGRVL